jgi:hypothetical protein
MLAFHLKRQLFTLFVNRDAEDPEGCTLMEWLEPNVIIALMEEQGIRFQHRVDADESEMIKRALPYIQQELGQIYSSKRSE